MQATITEEFTSRVQAMGLGSFRVSALGCCFEIPGPGATSGSRLFPSLVWDSGVRGWLSKFGSLFGSLIYNTAPTI